MLTATPEIEALQAKATAGDATAVAQLKVLKWNAANPVGSPVFYLRSQLDGVCFSKTTRQAFMLDDEPVVRIEDFGVVMLSKLEPALAPARLSKRLRSAFVVVLAGSTYLLLSTFSSLRFTSGN